MIQLGMHMMTLDSEEGPRWNRGGKNFCCS